MLNRNGKVIIYLEYNSIGFEREQFAYDGIKSNMFLYENSIPIMKTETITSMDEKNKPVVTEIKKWGLADKNGNILLTTQYDNFGYVESENQDKSINNVVIIKKINGIVVGKEGKYGVVNSIGKMIIPCEYDKIYSITSEGKDEFYLEQKGKTIKLDKYIADNKIEVYEQEGNKPASKPTSKPTNNTTTNNTTTNNNTTNNTTTNNTQTNNIIINNTVTTIIM